ncbi:hypothetical protein QQ045_009415 [Rhodiola kirilowii]
MSGWRGKSYGGDTDPERNGCNMETGTLLISMRKLPIEGEGTTLIASKIKLENSVDVLGEGWSKEFEMIPKVVTEEMNEALNAPFTEGEVKRALFQIHPSKAPGLDGFSAMFYQRNWEIVGKEVVREVLNCFNNGVLNAELNETPDCACS